MTPKSLFDRGNNKGQTFSIKKKVPRFVLKHNLKIKRRRSKLPCRGSYPSSLITILFAPEACKNELKYSTGMPTVLSSANTHQ